LESTTSKPWLLKPIILKADLPMAVALAGFMIHPCFGHGKEKPI